LVASQVRAPLGPGAIEVVPRTESGLPQVAIPATGPVRVEPAVPLPGKASIAVLPFDNMSGDPEQEYFSDGLTEDLITDLSQLSELLVTSRHAVFQYKNQMVGPRQVAEDLGVRYVLEGSVRRAAGRVRINAQLIDATSGYHVWADRYDGGAEDVFALQDTITQAIVGALELRLIGGKRTGRRYTDNLEAYDLFLQARESHLLRRTKDAAARARVALERAIELDPGFAAAHSLLAENYRQEWVFGWRSDPELLNHCLALARDAVRLDDGASHAHMVLGWIHLWRKEFEPAVVEARRSVALDPGHVEAWARLGHIVEQAGGPEEGLLLIEKALRLDPHHPFIYPFWLGHALLYLERDEEALSAFQRSRNRSPDFVAAHEFAAATLALLGRLDEARRATAATLHLRPDYSIRHQAKIMPYRDQAPLARLIEGWRKAGLPE
jgi:adenylate cyclase